MGDACEMDDDADGVDDASDACPGTVMGDAVLPNEGCSLEQLCPCEGPMGESRPWRGPVQFVQCVQGNAGEFHLARLIGRRERVRLVFEAMRSGCGAVDGWPRPRRRGWCERDGNDARWPRHTGRWDHDR